MQPIAIDLYCGLGGWAEGFLSEGYHVIGFDIERHDYGTGGYSGQLVLQDVLSLHGSQFKDATVIVASPPCQKYSYMAMPWKKAKALAEWYRQSSVRITELNALFDACFRIQHQAIEAAGRFIPLIVENVKGAQPWVGRAQAHFGSFYLWGDVGQVGNRLVAGPLHSNAGITPRSRRLKANPDGTGHPIGSWFAIADSQERGVSAVKCPGFRFDGSGRSFQSESVKISGQDWSRFAKTGEVSPHWRMKATKNEGGSWFNVAHNTESGHSKNPVQRIEEAGVKQRTSGKHGWFGEYQQGQGSRNYSSNSTARKAASAMIAKIPFPLAQYIARSFNPSR